MSILTELDIQVRACAQAAGFSVPEEVMLTEAPAHIAAELSTNIALQIGQQASVNPREVAEKIAERLRACPLIEAVEIAGPGFLNITAAQELYAGAAGEELGNLTLPAEHRKNINVEYISANPSGPLHIGNARGGPLGETLARVFTAQGHTVAREFYLNDIGGQANIFAESVLHYYRLHFSVQSVFPEKGYPAAYIQELATEIAEARGREILDATDPVAAMRVEAIARQVAKIRATTERMRIQFDRWYPQSHLIESGLSAAAFTQLETKGATLEKDGATWLKSGITDDDRETVLKKSDGTSTYFLDDLAYYWEKLGARGFDCAVVALGPGHHGHIARMQAGLVAIGFNAEQYVGLMYQNVQLKVDGQVVKMAKREGNFVTADAVLDEIPLDVFNWFMLSKANETHFDFDMQLAKDTSEKNPVYYVQYAHARIHSLIAKANSGVAGEYCYNKEERALLRQLDLFAAIIAEIGETYKANILPNYLYELATRYHHFYAQHRVITDDAQATYARLRLSRLTATTLQAGLSLLNISAPERM